MGSYVGLNWLGFWLQQARVNIFWFSLFALAGIACLGFWLAEYMTRRAARNTRRASKIVNEQTNNIS
jgi:hypothetical protein